MDGGFNFLIGNHYFSPDCPPYVPKSYLERIHNVLDVTRYRVMLFGDFAIPKVHWETFP